MNILLGGALGRMGKEVALAAGDAVAMGVDAAYHGQPCTVPVVCDYAQVEGTYDVAIDFSRPDALQPLLALAEAKHMPVVLCTTGYTEADLERIHQAAQCIPVLQSANMSLGVNVLSELVSLSARVLEGFDIEIVEKHHRMKVDSPSGTALMLYEAAKAARDGDATVVPGRSGHVGQRTKSEIGLHAVRGGTVTGDHEVGFYGNGEQILLTHRAENRSLFAQGALKAALWLIDKPAGLYTMRDVVRDMLGTVEK